MEYAVLFLPLIGAILGFFLKYFGDIFSQIFTTLLVCITALLSFIIFYNGVFHQAYTNHIIYQWIASGNFVVNWSINIDPLSSIMLVVVTVISALVHIYSIGYNRIKNLRLSQSNKILFQSFQRRFRQNLINGKSDKECLIISKNLVKY